MLCAKFSWNWSSGSGEEEKTMKVYYNNNRQLSWVFCPKEQIDRRHGERERGGQRTNLMISHAPLFSQHSARWTILITVASMLNYKNNKVVNVKYTCTFSCTYISSEQMHDAVLFSQEMNHIFIYIKIILFFPCVCMAVGDGGRYVNLIYFTLLCINWVHSSPHLNVGYGNMGDFVLFTCTR